MYKEDICIWLDRNGFQVTNRSFVCTCDGGIVIIRPQDNVFSVFCKKHGEVSETHLVTVEARNVVHDSHMNYLNGLGLWSQELRDLIGTSARFPWENHKTVAKGLVEKLLPLELFH